MWYLMKNMDEGKIWMKERLIMRVVCNLATHEYPYTVSDALLNKFSDLT